MKILFSIALWLTTLFCFSQNKTCKDFKTGVFKYSNPDYAEWTVKRNDSTQIETSTKTNAEIHSLIRWKSDCNYILTCQKILNSNYKNSIGKEFEVLITETSKTSYRCISKKNEVQNQDLELTMIKISEL
jgi:hypothetical protein